MQVVCVDVEWGSRRLVWSGTVDGDGTWLSRGRREGWGGASC